MNHETKNEINNQSKAEQRRLKRKQEQKKAYTIVGVALLILVALIVGVVILVTTLFSVYKKNTKTETVQVETVVEEPVIIEEPVVEVEEEEETTEPVVSENTISENDATSEISDEEKQALLDENVKSRIASMSLEQKVAGLFMVEPESIVGGNNKVTVADSSLNTALSNYPVGGLLFDADNMESEEQIQNMLLTINGVTTNNIFLAVEDRGGEESPFVKSGVLEDGPLSAQELLESAEDAMVYKNAYEMGKVLGSYGFNTLLGPVADVSSEGSYTESVSFGSDAATVRKMVRNTVLGLEDHNINTAVEFFPGYGDIQSDPAGTRPVSERTKEQIEEECGKIYGDAIDKGADMIVVSQIAFKNITVDVPACLSAEVVTDILRNDMEYDGIVMTDYLNKKSLTSHYKHADIAVMAIEAGCDMLLCPGDFNKCYNGILDAVNEGKISEERIDESLMRIYRVKYKKSVYAGIY